MYLILALIDLLAFTPVTRTEDANDLAAISEANSKDSFSNRAEAVVPLLARTMGEVFSDHAASIRKGNLRLRKRDSVLLPISLLFPRIPIETGLRH